MLLSMTGFGKAVATYQNKTIHVEVKTLNSKALDCSTRIAPIYREKEIEIRKMIQDSAVRGKVDFSLWIEKDVAVDSVNINIPLAKSYYQQLKQLADELGISTDENIMQTIMRMPDVMSKTEVEVLTDEEWAVARTAISEALQGLYQFRLQEGQALRAKFCEKIDNIASLMASIEPYEQSRVEKIRQRIIDGLKSLPDVEYDKNRLEQEMIYYIEKLDISEEKQRLTNHLRYFRETMDADEPLGVGKKLGFIAQEMGREINTMGSKANHSEIQKLVVIMKDELEKIKEQLGNIL